MVAPSRSRACTVRAVCRRMGLFVAATALFTAGCATTHEQLTAFVRSHEVELSTGQYVVRPPDSISIHAPGAPEVDGAQRRIRPDGKITLRLIGEVDVVGLTTEEIAAKLEAQLSRFYVEPEVVVEITGFYSQYYYVFGEVSSAGPRPFTGRDTLLKALAEARPTFLAWRSQIRILRPAPEQEERKVIVVDMDRIVERGDSTNDVLLQPGDVIQVPPSPLAWVGLRIREVLYPVGPLMSAYTTPAAPLSATRTYENEFGEDDNRDRDRRRIPWR